MGREGSYNYDGFFLCAVFAIRLKTLFPFFICLHNKYEKNAGKVEGERKGSYPQSKSHKPLVQKYYEIEQWQKQQRQDAESQVESICLLLHNGGKR
jgi:hypothetical protein